MFKDKLGNGRCGKDKCDGDYDYDIMKPEYHKWYSD